MASKREVSEGLQYQGVDEEVVYSVDVSDWGEGPTSPTVVIKDPDGEDVSSTSLDGSPNLSGNVITTPKVKALVEGEQYRVEIKFTLEGRVLEIFFRIQAEE